MPLQIAEYKPKSLAPAAAPTLRVSEILAGLTHALDLTEGQPMGHSNRACVLGMKLADAMHLSLQEKGDLYYAHLMKDAGCSSNTSRMFQILGSDEIAAKHDIKTTDWTKTSWESLQYALTHVRPSAPFLDRVRALWNICRKQKQNAKQLVQIRCERGSTIARKIGLTEASAVAIHSLDELWDGSGQPANLKGHAIPLLSRILNLTQSVEVFHRTYGVRAACDMVRKRSGRWFDPELSQLFLTLAKSPSFWRDVAHAEELVVGLEPRHDVLDQEQATLDNICVAFADVIDAKSPFTYKHSTGVAGAAVAIATNLGLEPLEIASIRRAALLHDIGKLSVPNSILEKPGKLDPQEWDCVKKHPSYSLDILNRIPGFGDISEMAASHHEKLDGSGYFRNMSAEHLSLPARILVVSDIFDALAAKRPYRDALPLEEVFRIMEADCPRKLDASCFDALKASSQKDRELLAVSRGAGYNLIHANG